jgi:hypothetical protein
MNQHANMFTVLCICLCTSCQLFVQLQMVPGCSTSSLLGTSPLVDDPQVNANWLLLQQQGLWETKP